ncbi:50S ribosomal protein L16 [Candidatus Woesearchaeota archaeon]|nr:50S ribosomal protein L16 [Candidatus Woesearchaeota archaeon]
MARIRKFAAYRRVERPYTRISKFRTKSYVRARPNCRIVRFDMGDLTKKFPCSVLLKSNSDMQVRDNALEAARQTSNRLLQKKIGKTGWMLKIRPFPHHILRENPLASGAGADRMSTGMKKSFGKPIGIAAQIKKGQIVFQIDVNKPHLAVAKDAMRRASSKMPFGTTIEVVENKANSAN